MPSPLPHVAHTILAMRLGGAEKLVHDLAVEHARRGAQASIICFDGEDYDTSTLNRHDIRIHHIPRRPMVFDWKVFRGLCRFVRDNGIQLLHAHDLSSMAYASATGTICRIPVIMTEHSRHYLDERARRRWEKRLFAYGLDALAEVSPQLAEASARKDGIPPRKILTIVNGVDIDAMQRADGTRFRTEIAASAENFLIGSVGRLEHIKGPDILLEAFADIAGSFPEARLVLTGSGSMESPLRERAHALGLAEKVVFAGARSNIPEILAALDCFVMPSRSEGLPFALLEAMAAGKPVISTSVGHIPEILEHGRNGCLVSSESPQDLAKALRSIITDHALRNSIARQAPAVVEQRYAQSVMFEQYESLYNRLCL
ncbi:glycosyltransferase family 4 protein [Desulfovibrio mangrovi]|uniref:glycosyltransferase family 4 protein n=1 Tax=Desulfovibrio mangrovi TaxID=2976983 RepID=UPI002247FDAC|nr:glycosyltransferase family 4 protein [Desulfovibrio mangrovi]UZP67531.1 glycosyltransferase family 4 protein [Desulfovibrio mangrovi]